MHVLLLYLPLLANALYALVMFSTVTPFVKPPMAALLLSSYEIL